MNLLCKGVCWATGNIECNVAADRRLTKLVLCEKQLVHVVDLSRGQRPASRCQSENSTLPRVKLSSPAVQCLPYVWDYKVLIYHKVIQKQFVLSSKQRYQNRILFAIAPNISR